jgi:hypothetical protein
LQFQEFGMRWWMLITLVCLLPAGCSDQTPTNTTLPAELQPSELTISEVKELLHAGMTTGDLVEELGTVPIIPKLDMPRMHWRLKDGSLWTDLEPNPDGDPKVVSWQFKSNG